MPFALGLSPGCFDHSSRGRVRTGRRRRSPSRAPCRRLRPPAWRRAHLTLSPRELPVLPEASPEAPRPAVASAGPCGTGCCPSLSTPTPTPAPRAPGGRGQVAPAPGGSRCVPSVCGGLRTHRQAHADCLSKMHGVPMDPSATFPPFRGGLWGRGHMCTPLRAQLPLSPLILSPPWGVDVDQRLRPPGPLPAGCLCPA